MTVSTTQVRITYTGDGVSTSFAVPWNFYASTDLTVVQDNVTKTLSVDYNVTGGGGSSGTVVMVVAPAAASNLQIILTVPLTQTVQYVNGIAFPADTINQQADRAIQAALRQNDLVTRAVRAPDGDASPALTLPVAAQRASKYPIFDSNGNIAVIGAAPPTQVNMIPTGADTGAVNALVVTLTGFVLQTFAAVWCSVNVTTTSTTPTLNVNATGAKTIKQADGTALAVGQLVAGMLVCLMYDGTAYRLISADGPTIEADTFTMSYPIGFLGSPTTTIHYLRHGNQVTLYAKNALSSTSNSTSFTFTGLPASIRPVGAFCVPISDLTDNSTTGLAGFICFDGASAATGSFQLAKVSGANIQRQGGSWTAANNKGFAGLWTATYPLL